MIPDANLVGVMYVGPFQRIEARFPERQRSFIFERSQLRWLPAEDAALFNPNRDWLVGIATPDLHKGSQTQHVLVRRAVALGDVIAVHAALQGIMNAFPGRYELSYQVAPGYVEIFYPHTRYKTVVSTEVPATSIPGVAHVVSLDGILEWDHNENGEKISRVDRSWRVFFGDRADLMQNLKPDFSLTIPETTRGWAYKELDRFKAFDGRPLIAVATRAVQKPRNLRDGLVREFCERLSAETDCRILLIDNDPKFMWNGQNVISIRSSVLEAIALLQFCDALCSMDSGAMWMGHCAAVPMVMWFGPTPPETKCNYHPLYPEGIRSLRMWEWVGCPEVCYENAKWCDFAYKCVKDIDGERFVRESIAAVMELVEYGKAK